MPFLQLRCTLTSTSQPLELKSRKFVVDVAASNQEINDLWSQLKEIDGEFKLGHSDKIP